MNTENFIDKLTQEEDVIINNILFQYCKLKGLGLEAIQEGAKYTCTHNPLTRKWYWKDDLILTVTHKQDIENLAIVVEFEATFDVQL